MAPKRQYDTHDMMVVAEKVTKENMDAHVDMENVKCEYVGTPLCDGTYDIGAPLRRRTQVAFRWTGEIEGQPQTLIEEIRCDNAISRGLSFPSFWQFAARVYSLRGITESSAEVFARQSGFTNVKCKMLGLARPASIPDESLPKAPGSIVTLNVHGAPEQYLLCAQVDDDYWFCSKGHYIDNEFQDRDPLNPDSLIGKNIDQDAWQGSDDEPEPSRLRQMAVDRKNDWNLLVATAHWMAEEVRAEEGERVINEGIATRHFEPHPFAWKDLVCKQRHKSTVAILWTWECDGERLQSLVMQRIDHLLHFRRVSSPNPKIANDERLLYRDLETIASKESTARNAPCRYLGIRLGPGEYEADPAKWPISEIRTSLRLVYFEWQHVTYDDSPYVVSIRIQKLFKTGVVPNNPLFHTAPSGLKFSCEFMESVARNVDEGVIFKGIAYESEKPMILYRVPFDGLDIQDSSVYWTLPKGQCVSWSVRQLSNVPEDQLYPGDEEEAYRTTAAEMGFDVLGTADEEKLEPFIKAPGKLDQRLWEDIEWQRPFDETCSCWFIANAGGDDKEQPVRLIGKSLACLRLELYATRCATSLKLRQTWERRIEENRLAVETLQNHTDLWERVTGPCLGKLLNPNETDLTAAKLAERNLKDMVSKHGDKTSECTDVFIEEIGKAVDMLKVVSWDAIHRERFFLTPKGLYDELVRNAQMNLSRRDDESNRRRSRLTEVNQAQIPRSLEESLAPHPIRRKDKYGLDLDEFKDISQQRPRNLQRALRMANEVHIDEMRMLLDNHYDQVHIDKWQAKHKDKKPPNRKSEYKVFRSVVQGRLRHLNERLVLPDRVKQLLCRPEDETDWGKLEALRRIICSELEGEVRVSFDDLELEDLAMAIENSKSKCYPDELGDGCDKAISGMRILVDTSASISKDGKAKVIEAIRALPKETVTIPILTRPRGTKLAPPMDETAHALFSEMSLQDIANDRNVDGQGMLDSMLLVLFDALFINQCIKWTKNDVANFQSTECMNLARWFLKGHQCCSKALFDGICAQCGSLLHGVVNQHTASSNKCTGDPINRDGHIISNPDGTVKTDAQPPFLLRWSPAFFAREVPNIFAHDEDTNRLYLVEGVHEPWLLKTPSMIDDRKKWLYCQDCKNRWFGEGRRKEHITFRDKASQAFMKPMRRKGHSTNVTTREAERQGGSSSSGLKRKPLGTYTFEPDEDVPDADGNFDEVETPIIFEERQQRPTLDEYQLRWDEKKTWHARPVPGEFSRYNLVPLPVEALWQDCPYVPFGELKSVESQSQLSVCRPCCSFEPANCDDGVPRYAHVTGEVNYRRRAMLQLASTMGFILNKSSGKSMGLTPHETDCVHECLSWGRVHGNNRILTFFNTVYESFQNACGKLLGKFKNVIPEGCPRARIRATNRESREPIEGELGETLGEEAIGMVVVDSAGHPMKYDALNVFSEVVATQSARLEVDIPGPDGKGWRRTDSQIDTQTDLGHSWRQNLSAGMQHIRQETWVPANDPHYDARVFPCAHPYGTGSLLAEVGSGGTQRFSRNRLLLIDSWFRRSAHWGFWSLNRLIQTELFFKNKRRLATGRQGASAIHDPDPVTRLFGTAQPSDIPESTAWWKRQQRDLFAITDEAELGLMSAMVTVTMNDSCPEMLAAIRRGPMAQPTDEEMIEYLLQRKRRDQERPAFENHSLEHVIAFQRRVQALKTNFMKRGVQTPLGMIRDWWDSDLTII